ncbi:MAG: serine hydrolase [Proteobacteria bacterium]|nr:serine hydrolase [Pseudomonadota bacterium]
MSAHGRRAIALLGVLALTGPALGGTLPPAELLRATMPTGITDNAHFVPGAAAAAALEPFEGTLSVRESVMWTEPAVIEPAIVFGKDPRRFPAVRLGFLTVGDDLVPATEDVIRAGSRPDGRAYWDLIVQPGRVWSEPADGGWSRAAFPFALVHSIEGETHNGIATFLYRRGRVSALRFQVVQQTSPFNVMTYFTAAGAAGLRFTAGPLPRRERILARHAAELRDAVPVRPWSELERRAGAAALAGFSSGLEPGELIVDGLDVDGTFYAKECRSAGGPLPWCDRARFGVWSVTKSLANELALLRLAERFGPEVFALRIRDYVPEARRYERWSRVRFEDCINMATGLGNGSARRDPNDSGDGYIDPTYTDWANTRSRDAKVAKLLRIAPAYPWGPGEVVRYRDQDMFLLGVAMDRFLKSRAGPRADLWSMLEHEVFEPIGIHSAPVNRTLEAGAAAGQPLMAYGYYATLGDLVKVARLYHSGGRHDGRQLLYGPRVRELLDAVRPHGLPTGAHARDGELTYFNSFWYLPHGATDGCRRYVPQMLGWGANLVALYPNGITGVRLAHTVPERWAAETETTAMADVADRLAPFCR